MRYTSLFGLVIVASLSAACASAPPVVAPKAPVIAPDQKMSWILRLENQRILRDPAPPPAPAPIVAAPVKRKPKTAPPPPPPAPVVADLTTLASDSEPRIRRRRTGAHFFFAHRELLDQVFAHAETGTWRLRNVNVAVARHRDLRLDNVLLPVTL